MKGLSMITRMMLLLLICFSLCSCDVATRRAEVYICLDQTGEISPTNNLCFKMEQIRAIIPDFVSVDERYTLNQVGNLPLLHLCVTTADKETSEWACRLIVEKFVRLNCAQSNDFVQYAINFEVPQSDVYPPLPVLPDTIYQSALSLKETDTETFYLATALIFSKYHNDCLRHNCGTHILFEDVPSKEIFGPYLEEGNTKYFLVRSLAEAVSGVPRTRENVLRENSPLYIEHETWYASSTSAWLYFTKKVSPTNAVHRELGRAWIRDRDKVELAYCGEHKNGEVLGVGTLPDEEKYQ